MVSSFSLDEVVDLCTSVLAGEFKVLQDLWKPYKPPWKQFKRSTACSWTCYSRRLVILTYESLPKPGKKKKLGIQLCPSWPHWKESAVSGKELEYLYMLLLLFFLVMIAFRESNMAGTCQVHTERKESKSLDWLDQKIFVSWSLL